MIEKLETSPRFYKVVWAVLAILFTYAAASLITAIRWW